MTTILTTRVSRGKAPRVNNDVIRIHYNIKSTFLSDSFLPLSRYHFNTSNKVFGIMDVLKRLKYLVCFSDVLFRNFLWPKSICKSTWQTKRCARRQKHCVQKIFYFILGSNIFTYFISTYIICYIKCFRQVQDYKDESTMWYTEYKKRFWKIWPHETQLNFKPINGNDE